MIDMPKTALVTGGAHRIGRGICEGLSEAGYGVAVHYNSSSKQADELVAELVSAGGRAVAVQADLTDRVQTRELLDKASQTLGPIGLLVNNASLFEADTYESATTDDLDAIWDAHFEVHVKAPAMLAAAFAEQNLSDGLIVNIIDERVWKLTPKFASYTLSKSTLWTATKTMAQALSPRIRVNAIGPGPTLPSERQTLEDFEAQVDTLLLKRAPSLQEFTDTILFFAKARSVTGQMIALDGGQHLGWMTPDQALPE